ncbi:uncharacterized protein [Argopecten irradians]|uniref:uncharacterized protein n=1 Tax=Argopecten irradians TaxID=31199 RepID=UPI0037208170
MIRNLLFITILIIGYVHSAPSLLPLSASTGDDALCSICEIMVEDLRSLIGENSTEAQVEDKMDDICNRLAADRETCTSMVHQYLPALFSKISGAIDPKSACVELKVCTKSEDGVRYDTPLELDYKQVISNTIPQEPEAEPMVEQEIDNVIPQFPNPYSGRKGKPVNIKQKLDSNETCQICEFLIQVLDASIATNQTEAAINNTIMQICSALPDELASFCRSITPALINVIEKGIDPEKGCVTLRLCQTANSVVHMKGLTCDMCRSSMKEVFGKAGMKVCDEVRGLCSPKKAGYNAHKESVIYEEMEDVPEEKMATIPNEEEDIQANPLECELCKVLVTELNKVILNNKSDEAINATVYQICAEAPGALSGICMNYAPQVVSLLEKGFDASAVCKLVRACSAATAKIQEEVEEVEAGTIECELCKMLVDELDQVLANNRSDVIINSTIYQLCGEVPGTLKNYCMTYAPKIVQLLVTGFDAETVCSKLGVCSDLENVQVQAKGSSASYKNDNLGEIIKDIFPTEFNSPEDTKCEICKAIIEIIDQYLESNQTKEAINDTVYGLCTNLPGGIQGLCQNVAPQVVVAVESGLDPTTACTFVKLCTEIKVEKQEEKKEKESLEEIIKDLIPNDVTNPEDTKCDFCKAIIQFLDEYLEANQTRDAINNTVYGLCADFPEAFQGLCQNVAPQVVLAVESGLDPTSACTFVKLCTGGNFEMLSEEIEDRVKDAEQNLDVGDTKCELCKLVINLVDQYIGRNTSEAELNGTVYKLCSLLPGDIKAACNLFAPELVKAMESGFDPARACALVKFCGENATVVEMYEEEEEPMEYRQQMPPLTGFEGIRAEIERTVMKDVEGFGDDKCDICQFVITLVDKYIDKNSTQIAINNTVYELCGTLPSDIKSTCNLFAPQLVKALDSGFDPERACEAVRLCTNGTTLVVMEPGLAEVNPIIEPESQEVEEPREEMVEPIVEEPRESLEEEEPRVEEEEPRVEEEEPRVEEKPRIEEEEPRIEEEEPTPEEEEPRYDEEPRAEAEEPMVEEEEPKVEEEEPREAEPLNEEENTIQFEKEGSQEEYEENHNIEELENVEADAKCELCELMIGILDRYINMNSTQEKLNQTVYGVCAVLPSQLQGPCLAIAPNLIKSIEAGLNPESTCTQANFCVNGTEIEFPIYVPGLTCEACHSIVEHTNPEKYNVEAADIICTASCPRRHRRSVSEEEERSARRIEALRGDPVWACDVCEFMVKAVNVYLTDNQTMEQVTEHLNTLCSYFPAPYAQTCKNSVGVVVQEFDKGIDVMEFCNTDNNNKCGTAAQDMELLFDTLGKPEDWECNMCKHSLSTMNELLDQDHDHIKMYMGGVCDRLPAPHNKQCHIYIQTQGEQVLSRVIERLLSPEQVCQLAGVCGVKQHPHPNMSTL